MSLAIFSDWNDALTGIVHALKGFKVVGCLLRPELKPEQAAQWLRDCLNPEKRERLNPEQVFMLLRLARQENYHAAKHWLDAELGYEQGRPLDPVDEYVRLQVRGADLARELRSVVDRMEKLNQPTLAAVSGRAA
jgi:hypothetical protein